MTPSDTIVGALIASDTLSQRVIGEAMHVHRVLGSGFKEEIYQAALMIRLRKTGIQAVAQRALSLYFEGELVGDFITDIIVEDRLLLELKAVSTIVAAHEVQLVNYLTATKIGVGLLLNFGSRSLEIKRRTLGYHAPALKEEDAAYSESY